MNTILIVICVLIALIIFIKAKELKAGFVYKTLAVVGILVAISVAYVWMSSGISLTTYEGFLSFGRVYLSWLSSLFGNARGITGYAVQQGWGFNSTTVLN